MASKINKITLALVFLLIAPPSLGQPDGNYPACFLMCLEMRCPVEFVNIRCLQHCNTFCRKEEESAPSPNMLPGRPMLSKPIGGSSESNGQPQQMNFTNQVFDQSNVKTNPGTVESNKRSPGLDQSNVQSNQGSNKSNFQQSAMMTESLEGLKNSSEPVDSAQGSTKELHGRPIVEGTMGQETTMNPMDELKKSNAWPMMGDSMQVTKGGSMEKPTTQTMEDDDEMSVNNMEGLKVNSALPMLVESWGGGHN